MDMPFEDFFTAALLTVIVMATAIVVNRRQ